MKLVIVGSRYELVTGLDALLGSKLASVLFTTLEALLVSAFLV